MNQSKGFLVISSIVGMFILVYGTSIILRLLLGNYLMAAGLFDLSYAILALSCSVPFIIYIILNARPLAVILVSGFLFLALFIPVQFAFVTMIEKMSPENLVRILTIFPLTAIIFVFVAHFVYSGQKSLNKR